MLKRLCSLSWITRTNTFARNVENRSMLGKHTQSAMTVRFICHVEQEKRKVGMSDDTEQSEMKKIRVPLDIPLSCITNPTPSDIELLARLFPSENRFLLEMILQGCYGNILHVIQVISRSSSTSSGTSPSVIPMPPQNPTTVPSTSSSDSPFLNYGATFLNSTYRYLYPGFVPPSYMLPGSPGMGYYRPYFPNLATPSNQTKLNGSTSSESTGNGDVPTSAKQNNSLDMIPSPSPQREETCIEHVCLKCNLKQKKSKVCERCGQHNVIVNHADSI